MPLIKTQHLVKIYPFIHKTEFSIDRKKINRAFGFRFISFFVTIFSLFLSFNFNAQTIDNEGFNEGKNSSQPQEKPQKSFSENPAPAIYVTGDATLFMENTEISGKIVYIKPKAEVRKIAKKNIEKKAVLAEKTVEKKQVKKTEVAIPPVEIKFLGDTSTQFSLADIISTKAIDNQYKEQKFKKALPHVVDYHLQDFGKATYLQYMAAHAIKYFQYANRHVSRPPPSLG